MQNQNEKSVDALEHELEQGIEAIEQRFQTAFFGIVGRVEKETGHNPLSKAERHYCVKLMQQEYPDLYAWGESMYEEAKREAMEDAQVEQALYATLQEMGAKVIQLEGATLVLMPAQNGMPEMRSTKLND